MLYLLLVAKIEAIGGAELHNPCQIVERRRQPAAAVP